MKRIFQMFAGIVALTFVVAIASPGVQASNQGPGPQEPESPLLQQLQQATGGKLRISRHAETGKVSFLGASPQTAIAQPALAPHMTAPEPAARAFLQEYGALFGVSDAEEELTVLAERSLEDGRSFVRFQQAHRGVPVMGGELIVQVQADGAVVSANGEVLPGLDLDVQPAVDGATARDTALARIARDYGMAVSELQVTEEPALRIYNPALLGGPGPRFSALVWQVEVSAVELLPIRELVLVDAHLGNVALHFNQIHTAKNRNTYDAEDGSALPGTLRRSEGDGAYGDADVDNAHDYAGDTYDFFFNEHGRDSLNDAGMTLVSTTHYCPDGGSCPYANAFWNGSQMVYGEGMPADDVVGHELTHGVTNFSSNLFYYYQSGAINESLSDVWGEFIDQTNGAGTDTVGVRWQLGEDLPGSIGVIRDMSHPPAHGQPDRIGSANYFCLDAISPGGDSGGVHVNSGVNNKAAFLMVDGGTFNGYTVTGMGIPKVADLYYEVQTNLLTSGSNYADLYDALIQAALNLGFSAPERQVVQDALDAVEMNQPPCGSQPEAPICPIGQTPAYVFDDDLETPAGGNWASAAISGVDAWFYPQNPNPILSGLEYATSGDTHMWGFNYGGVADYYIAMTSGVTVPDDGYLHFHHDWNFEDSNDGSIAYDGGVVEYSVNGGGWTDAGALFSENGYNGTITATYDNPLGGRGAFTSESYGYTASRLDLSTLAGDSVRFRFRIGTDGLVEDGKVHYLGASTLRPNAWKVAKANELARDEGREPFTVSQPRYNLLDREVEDTYLAMCADYDIPVVPWSPLAQGVLTGKYSREDRAPEDATAHEDEGWKEYYLTEANFEVVDEVKAVAEELDATPPQVGLAWLMHHDPVPAPIIGARTVDQLEAAYGTPVVG